MIALERTARTEGPVDAVVEFLADFAHAELWDSGTVSCTRIDPGPITVGTRWRNVSRFRGKETELTYTLVRREPARLTFTGENKTVRSSDDLVFVEEDGGTRIHYRARFAFTGLAMLAEPFLKGALNSLADDTIAQLGTVLDQRWPRPLERPGATA
ncbi:SRPBCC family protein [Pseudonocardia spinosispora]|uniref:SRPBCC family protein n=1 Tax=Pseudonocardia spinosispora TaxID=103441 RepID=UPI0004183647|nr:SRPBCC family protein [Pseudonocardia spinosispora]